MIFSSLTSKKIKLCLHTKYFRTLLYLKISVPPALSILPAKGGLNNNVPCKKVFAIFVHYLYSFSTSLKTHDSVLANSIHRLDFCVAQKHILTSYLWRLHKTKAEHYKCSLDYCPETFPADRDWAWIRKPKHRTRRQYERVSEQRHFSNNSTHLLRLLYENSVFL